jgi:hypothetical protein
METEPRSWHTTREENKSHWTIRPARAAKKKKKKKKMETHAVPFTITDKHQKMTGPPFAR